MYQSLSHGTSTRVSHMVLATNHNPEENKEDLERTQKSFAKLVLKNFTEMVAALV